MNYVLIFRLLSILFLIIAFSFGTSMGVAYISYEGLKEETFQGWTISLTITLGLAIIGFILGRKAPDKIFRREALSTIGLGWIACSLLGALPYWMIIPEMSYIDALFESASGLTTTGATVINTPETLPPSLQFWRCLSQWLGGLGIVVFFVAILGSLGVGAKILYSNESSGQSSDIESSRVQQGILRILYLYAGLTASCAILFKTLGMTTFDAICHSFATLATGGFSNYTNSIAHFNSPEIEWVTTLFMILGGLSFVFMVKIFQARFNQFQKNTEYKVYLALIFGFTLFIGFVIHRYTSIDFTQTIRISAFQVTSIITTTGFSTIDYNLTQPVAHVLLLILMGIGGCSGSTAGGIKVLRIIVGAKICFLHIEKAFHPRVVRILHANGNPVEHAAQETILSYFTITFMTFAMSLLLFALFQPNISFEGNFSAVMACFFNIGPAFAELGPSHNYAFLSEPTKVLLILLMIAGRLELLAILVLFFPSLWKDA